MTGATPPDKMEQTRRLHPYQDANAMSADVARQIADLANVCICEHESFRIVLTGGKTPVSIYRKLSKIDTEWGRWHIYFGDERCLTEGDEERNDKMAYEAWLSHVPIPEPQIHTIPAHLGPEAGASDYSKIIAPVEEFDLVLLGLGEDGHVASLFPGQSHDARSAVVAVYGSPKPPPERVSLSEMTLGRGRHTWFLVSGEGKREALTRWLQGADIPANRILPEGGVDIFTDVLILE